MGVLRQRDALGVFFRWRRKYEQYYLGLDIGVTNLPGQQATISGCVDRELEQRLYNLISDNTPVFTPEPNEDEVTSCMDIIGDWIAERHPLDSRTSVTSMTSTNKK